MANDQYDVIIVGSGAGGLGAALTLAKAGRKTLLLERHYQVGGYITSFRRKGFSFDPGAAILSGNAIRAPLDTVEMSKRVDLDLIKVKSPYLRFHCPKADVSMGEGAVFGLKPDEVSTIERATGEAAKLLFDEKMQKVSMLDWLRENVADPTLSLLFAMPCFLALILPPSKVPASMAIVLKGLGSMDMCYPKGGIIAIANAYAEAFKLLGGELRTRTTVSKILVKDQKVEGVELENGEKIRSKTVISNAGLGNTVKLVGEDLLEKGLVDKIAKLKPTLSTFAVFLGLDYIPDIIPYTFSVALADVDELEKVCQDLESGKFYESEKDPVPVYIHIPSSEAPGLAPPGQTSMSIFVWAPYKLAQGDWRDKKEHYTEVIIKAVENRLLPGLSQHIVHKEAATPLTYERYVAKQGGAVLGYAISIDQEPIDGDALPIEGLHCVGDTVAGALAEPGSIQSGIKCAQGIIGPESAS